MPCCYIRHLGVMVRIYSFFICFHFFWYYLDQKTKPRQQQIPQSDEQRLLQNLMRCYDKSTRPADHLKNKVMVKFHLKPIQIIELVSVTNQLKNIIKGLRVRISLLRRMRSEEHTSELQSRQYLVCRLLLEKKNNTNKNKKQLLVFIPTHSST